VRRAVYAGTFDPLTLGHVDVASRAARLFDELIVAVGHNPGKQRLLSLETRLEVLREDLGAVSGVRVDHFTGLLVDYCRSVGAGVIVRGLRDVPDFGFESQLCHANRDMAPEIETVFVLCDPKLGFVSSSLVKEIAAAGGPAERYLPAASARAMRSLSRA
jgi:pantetheine-phosphate adenylyltransferase